MHELTCEPTVCSLSGDTPMGCDHRRMRREQCVAHGSETTFPLVLKALLSLPFTSEENRPEGGSSLFLAWDAGAALVLLQCT